jgi:hypothetical protein
MLRALDALLLLVSPPNKIAVNILILVETKLVLLEWSRQTRRVEEEVGR